MPLNIPEKVSSLDTLTRSIVHDAQVSRWFLLLIDQPEVRKKILAVFPEEKKTYSLLGIIPWAELLGGALGCLLFAWLGQTKNFIWLGPLVSLAYPAWRLIKARRRLVSQLGRKLLMLEFPAEELPRKSLYQIAEILSRAYAIPSLVDTIYHWDRALRFGVILFYLIATFIYPLKIWLFLPALGLSLFLIKTLIRWRWIYSRLR